MPSVCASDYEAAHFSAAFSVALFGCLRVGEFTLSKQSQMHQVIGIENIKFILNSGVQQIDLVIPASKTDQYGNDCLVKISENKSSICPVRLLKHYLHLRPSFDGLFCHYREKLLTRYQFAAVLNKALNFIRIDSSRIKTHSFRIGAATMHFENGVSQEDIQKMGRWKCDAYKRYIR